MGERSAPFPFVCGFPPGRWGISNDRRLDGKGLLSHLAGFFLHSDVIHMLNLEWFCHRDPIAVSLKSMPNALFTVWLWLDVEIT